MHPPREAVRVAIAGAASLRGKELKQCLEDRHFPANEIRLLDEEIVAGTLTVAGDEPAVIETVDEDSFEHVRFAFFTGSAAFSSRHGAEARRAGAAVIDLSSGLATDQGGRPWLPSMDFMMPPPSAKVGPGEAQSLFLVPSAPADVAVSLSTALAMLGLRRLSITFLQPVSERGTEGVEELEHQVNKLLTFEPFGQNVFGAQVAFNMLSVLGADIQNSLVDVRKNIASEVRGYLADRAPMPAIFVVQAPVFYSHTFSAYAEFESAPLLEEVANRINGAGLKITPPGEAEPSNISVIGEDRPIVTRPERAAEIENGLWLWGAADNLRVPAATAVAIAEKLLAS